MKKIFVISLITLYTILILIGLSLLANPIDVHGHENKAMVIAIAIIYLFFLILFGLTAYFVWRPKKKKQ